ncbi:MAG: hypothetical protein WCI73_13650, partial [Phycisphaerae bacterium]
MRSMDAPRNNFDVLRLLLALSVGFSHSIAIAPHQGDWEPLARASGQITIGLVAVGSFFCHQRIFDHAKLAQPGESDAGVDPRVPGGRLA